ncbi:anaerobic sulfatase maturase [Thalassoglobus polymorphus]|uniref:Anaerobic sulfatase-maturating enzyme n=1 Tax=Thalassoglobus polymorphus TaxID=2527994 RepID=A0A517QS28_9PLAN|nr:anaerobic sulfatase maturase [Thalassoglobus polymorphus]QDT34428.1 Anaerobic sulfatase-maturating enzyme [Thalassoglobus polymorphus]
MTTPETLTAQMLHVMAKPIGPICNLDCEYCYYLHKEDLYPKNKSWRMTSETLETYIQQYIEAQPAGPEEVTFAWQGGEPTLLGLDFFKRIVELEKKHARPGQKIANALQTNGVLLDEEWVEFFKKEGFLIGLSVDGPAELHDRYRYDKKGNGTFDAVLKAMKLLQQYQVEFNALVVVNRENSSHGRRVYSYLRDNGIEFMQFIPIVERRGIGVHPEDELEEGQQVHAWDHLVSSRSVVPEQYGRFLCEIFDEWVKRDVGKVFVQVFDQALAAWLDLEPSLCVFRKQCGRALAIEHNGDLYSCDHFVEPEYKLGNIHELPIIELANSQRQLDFGRDKETTLPQYCLDCEVRFACNGECPKNRFIDTPTGEAGLNYLCGGYRMFFNHIDPLMKQMATELKANRPAANVMQQFRKKKTPASKSTPAGRSPSARTPLRQVGRNDPCPCGSGRKFKKCCGVR